MKKYIAILLLSLFMISCENAEVLTRSESAKILRVDHTPETILRVSLIGEETGNFYLIKVKQTDLNKAYFVKDNIIILAFKE